jgi:hypothetical protein
MEKIFVNAADTYYPWFMFFLYVKPSSTFLQKHINVYVVLYILTLSC